MTNYVLGFAFSEGRDRVALIQKERPPWQRGSLNGIGGHIEEYDENPHAAMVREFQEETGALIPKWESFASMGNDKWSVIVYRAFMVDLDELKTTTDEEVMIVEVSNLFGYVLVANLHWLIPLALDRSEQSFARVDYP